MHLLSTTPKQTIKLHIFKSERKANKCDHRLNRVRIMNQLPLSVWAHWVVQSIHVTIEIWPLKYYVSHVQMNASLLYIPYAILLVVACDVLD